MAVSLIYRSAWIYNLLMRCLYGRTYKERDRALADLIPEGASVLDVCCGPATLYHRELKARQTAYTGLDLNEGFVKRLQAVLGVQAHVWDVSQPTPLPKSDIVVMQASLYHFLPDNVGPVIQRLRQAARQKVLIAEPVRNLSTSRFAWLAHWAKRMTNPGSGPTMHRFDGPSLAAVFTDPLLASAVQTAHPIADGREHLYVLRPAITEELG